MDISAFSRQNKVTKMCPKYILTCYYILNTDKSNNIQNYQVYTVYANMNMASTRIVCSIYLPFHQNLYNNKMKNGEK